MFQLVPSPRLGEQARRRRIILEQRQMRRDVFRAPQPRPFRPGQIERANPQRTGDGAHEHHAIGRKPDRPARIERRLRARLVAFAQFLRGDSETAQDRPIIRLRAMQPADPEPRNIRRNRNAGRAPPLRQGDPRPHKNAACPRQQRARGHPRLAKDKSVHARIPKRGIWKAGDSRFRIFRQRDKAGVGQRHRPIRRSFHQRRPAQGGARLVDGQNALRRRARKDPTAFSPRGTRAVTGAWSNIENGNWRGRRHTVRARHARIWRSQSLACQRPHAVAICAILHNRQRFLRERLAPSARAARSVYVGRSAIPAAAFSQRAAAGAWPNNENEPRRGSTQFVPGRRAYSAHNRLHVNTPAPCRFAQSYIIHDPFGL